MPLVSVVSVETTSVINKMAPEILHKNNGRLCPHVASLSHVNAIALPGTGVAGRGDKRPGRFLARDHDDGPRGKVESRLGTWFPAHLQRVWDADHTSR